MSKSQPLNNEIIRLLRGFANQVKKLQFAVNLENEYKTKTEIITSSGIQTYNDKDNKTNVQSPVSKFATHSRC